MQWGVLLGVAVGGAIGSLARYFVSRAIQPPTWTGFPWGIFVVNVSGGFIMGVIAGLGMAKVHLSPEMRGFLMVGILGGYTTFSTFSLESALLIERGAYGSAAAYIAGSALLSIAALFSGLWLVRLL